MSQLVETRWTRYGKDRVYVRNQAGDEIGRIDLKEHKVVAKAPAYESSLEECLRRWTSEAQREAPHESPTEVTDLVDNVAGAAAWAERERVNSQAPVLNLVARVLGVKTLGRKC